MIKLRFSKPSVKTYMEGRITVCKYNCTLYDNNTKRIISEFPATGTSKCAEEDTLNASYGVNLADSRAKMLAYKTAGSFISEEELNNLFKEAVHNLEIINFVEGMKYLKKKEAEHIKYLNSEISE